jgi:hypothetical protein
MLQEFERSIMRRSPFAGMAPDPPAVRSDRALEALCLAVLGNRSRWRGGQGQQGKGRS